MITEQQFAPNRFQHCSTISSGPPGSGTFLAYYTGEAECHPSQHVEIKWFSDENVEAETVSLEPYTGNPILVETITGTTIIYSKFENTNVGRIEWWQYCSLWAAKLDVHWENHRPKIRVGVPKQIIIEEPDDENPPPKGLGYLPRCHPIPTKDGMLLPLYREHAPNFYGVILKSLDADGLNWEFQGTIGKDQAPCIQPTIWYDSNQDLHKALLRNFSRSGRLMAYYSESADNGKTWSPIKHSPYANANNSTVVLSVKDEPVVIWNNDPTGRNNISMGTFHPENPRLLAKLDSYGSYPSICATKDHLKVAYTAKANPLKTPYARTVIKVKAYDLEAIVRSCRNDTSWAGFSRF